MRGITPLVVAAAPSLWGCTKIPPGRDAVDRIALRGNEHLGDEEILAHIVSAETPRLFGLFKGLVYDYALFTPLVLQRDLARIERLYRRHGYYQARVQAGRIRYVDKNQVRIEIVVDEGPPVLNESMTVLAPEVDPELRAALDEHARRRLELGKPFDEKVFDAVEGELRALLTDRGYAWARVTRSGVVDVVKSGAFAHYRVDAGPAATFGAVTVRGNGEIPAARVRLTAAIRPGQRYSTAALRDAEDALLALGVFSSVQITPELGDDAPDRPRAVPIRVRVAVARLRAAKVGGGLRLDAIKSDVHVLAGWQSKNFLGGMRSFSVDGRFGVVLYPLRINNLVAPQKPLPEGELKSQLQQPGLFEARTTGFFEPAGNVYAVLLKTNPSPDDPVLGYLDVRGTAGLERRWGQHFYGRLEQHVQYAMPFAYAGSIDPALAPVVLVYPRLVAQLDVRDDPSEPHSGAWIGAKAESAVFGTGRDVKVTPEVRGYVPLGPATLASRLRIGMLVPFDYGGTLEGQLDDPFAPKTQAEVRDLQVMYFRGLFAGGTDSNRGYPPRTISPHTIVPFLNPQVEAQRVSAVCDRASPDFDAGRCSVPIGGLTSWEASLEVRVPLVGKLMGALFCDAADVAPGRMQFRLDHPHVACGTGARYGTPLGGLRLDLGYRIPGAQFPAGTDPIVEGAPGTFFGAPLNLSLGIGEAY